MEENTIHTHRKRGAISFVRQNKIIDNITDDKYRCFFIFCCCTGMRVCEALYISPADIDRRKKIIHITLPDTKTKKHTRDVPYLPELIKNIDMSRDTLFADITEEGSKKYFSRLFATMKYPISRHSTRHTFVSICRHINIDTAVIQGWVGHTDSKMTTQVYTHRMRKGESPILAYLTKLKTSTKN